MCLIEEILPYNFLAEKAVLNILINYPSVLDQTDSYLSIESFYVSSHKVLYKTILFLYAQNQVINSTTVISYLHDNDLLQKIGGIKEVINIIGQRESLYYLKPYISLLNDKLIRRNLIKFGENLIEWGYLTKKPLEHILNNVELEVSQLFHNYSSEKILSASEILLETIQDLQTISMTGQNKGYMSQYEDLDSMLNGFQKSDLIVLAGRPSMGKTALALNFGKNIAEIYTVPVIFFSLEMSRKQVMYRLLSLESFVDSSRLRLGKITQYEWSQVLKATDKLSSLPIFIEDNSLITLTQIKLKIKKITFEYKKIALVIIDYLQLIKTHHKVINRVQEITFITKSLKSIAKEFDFPLLVLSQLSRSVEARINKRPILSDLRESGCTEILTFQDSLTGSKVAKLLLKQFPKLFTSKFSYKKIYQDFSFQVSSNHKIYLKRSWHRLREKSYSLFFLSFKENNLLINNTSLNFSIGIIGIKLLLDCQVKLYHNIIKNNILFHNSIEQDADVVLMIYRDDYYKKSFTSQLSFDQLTEVIIAKHRNGPTGFIELIFNISINKFFTVDY